MHINSVMQDPRAFTTLVNSLKPDEVRATKAEIRALIDIEEKKRQEATAAVEAKTTKRDAAQKKFDDATSDLDSTLQKLQLSNDKIGDINDAIKDQKELIKSKQANLAAAETTLDNRQNEYEKVKVRVNNEKSVLNQVLGLLQKLKDGDAGKDFVSKFETETKGLALLSRTSKLLANPSFISTLAKADPKAVQKVIDLINQLIVDAEEEEEAALNAQTVAEDAKKKAEVELTDAQTKLTDLEKDLNSENDKVLLLKKEEESKTAVQLVEKNLLDKAQKELKAKEDILASEETRINGEQGILLEGEKHLGVLSNVLDVLEE